MRIRDVEHSVFVRQMVHVLLHQERADCKEMKELRIDGEREKSPPPFARLASQETSLTIHE